MANNKPTAAKPTEISSPPPVVAVLGHVDHGKTTLLDAIRKTNIAGGEHGGITQKIGASSITIDHEGAKRTITFIDTPGHEAFSKMRGRGVVAADIALLIVSAADGVMPQTRESIDLLKSTDIPFIAVLTKVDLPGADINKVKQQLLKEQIMLEGLGGDVPTISVSAKEGRNIKELLDLILLVFDLKGLGEAKKELLFAPFQGIVIESKLDTKAGPRATVVIKQGKVLARDDVLCEGIEGRVRTLISDNGDMLTEASVGQAVEILGFTKVPPVGGLVTHKHQAVNTQAKAAAAPLQKALRLEEMPDQDTELAIILCADTQGALEAITAALPEKVRIISQKLGEVSEADILLAKSTGAIVLSFNTRIRTDIAKQAQLEKILLKNYTIIYELIDEVGDVLEGKALALEERIFGQARILASFPFEKTKVMGVKVLDGRVAKGDKARLMRDEQVVAEGTIASVRQGKNQVSKIEKGQEGGIVITPLLDFTIGDMVICHS